MPVKCCETPQVVKPEIHREIESSLSSLEGSVESLEDLLDEFEQGECTRPISDTARKACSFVHVVHSLPIELNQLTDRLNRINHRLVSIKYGEPSNLPVKKAL